MAVHLGTHPSADVLRAFGLGKLNDTAIGTVMDHLDLCADCRSVVSSQSGDGFLDRLRQAHGRSSTPAPAKVLPPSVVGPKPPATPSAIPNLPPELANNPHYEILRELGRGGMGVVYLAKNKLMDRLEVLKVVNKALLDRPGSVERFLREIRSAAKLSHANVVAAYSAIQQGELLAFAMEYVEGEDLAAVVKTQGPLPVPNACFYVQQAALGLQHAFEKKMVHRDIKPQNLILAREGKKHIVKVLDFGLAKVMREKTDDTGLTGEGKMLGTPDYIAPEQTLDAAKADIRADIYSLGCTLYFLLSGSPPFSANSLGAILLAHQMKESKPLNLVRAEVPEELASVVRKMMAKEPGKRYQTPLEVVQALSPFVKQGAVSKTSPDLSVGTAKAVKAKEPPAPVADVKPIPPVPEVPHPAAWESLTEGSILSAHPRRSGAVRRQKSPTVNPAARRKWLIGGGVAVGLLLLGSLSYWLAVVMLRVETPNGTLIVEMNDDEVEARIKSGKLILSGPDGKVRYTLTAKERSKKLAAGPYKIRVEGADGLVLDTPEFTLKKGGQVKVRVTLEPKAMAKKDSPGKPVVPKKGEVITNSIGMKLVRVEPGIFLMGSPENEEGRLPNEHQHEVEITRPFYVGVYEVTQEQYGRVMYENPSYFSATGGGKGRVNDMDTSQFPVERVSWEDAVKFCGRLSELREEKSKERLYRLPTEAEWEYVCRGGPFFKKPSPPFSFGNHLPAAQANSNGNFPYGGAAKGAFLERTTKVGSYPANALGVHDLHGNVWEWCADRYDAEYYKRSPRQDPQGPENGERRVLRGGGWDDSGWGCRADFRGINAPGARLRNVGVRVVLVAGARQPNTSLDPDHKAADTAWVKQVAAMSAAKQVEAVAARLKELNPGFDGKMEHKIEGGQVVSLKFGTDNVKDISPLRALTRLQELYCGGTWEGKRQLADLTPLKGMKLTHLHFAYSSVSDLSPLMDMKLEFLDFGYMPVSDLSPLKDMKPTKLVFWHIPVTDAGLEHLQGMSSLRDLEFVGTKVTDGGFVHLKKLPDLEILKCGRMKLTGAGLVHLKGMSRLQILHVQDTELTDGALVHLKSLLSLRELRLEKTRVTDAGLEHLATLKNLAELNLQGTAVTDKGVAKFKVALPKCNITR